MSHSTERGFTLVELTLSMAFISILLITITACVIQISHIYDRGLTIKEVNQAGRLVSSELQSSINATAPFEITGVQSRYIVQDSDKGARLCLGTDSYIMNFAKALDSNAGDLSVVNVYNGTSGVGRSPIHMVRVEDNSYYYCQANEAGVFPDVNGAKAVELLDAGDRELAIHNFSIDSPDSLSVDSAGMRQRLYTVSFTLGTNEQAAIDDALRCKPPADADSNATYCSINQFTITARAGNAVK